MISQQKLDTTTTGNPIHPPLSENHLSGPSTTFTPHWKLVLHINRQQHSKCSSVFLFYQSHKLHSLHFRSASSIPTSFFFRSLRASLSWLLSCPYFVNGQSLALFLDKPRCLHQLYHQLTTDAVLLDIQDFMRRFSSFKVYNKNLIPRHLYKDDLSGYHSYHPI